ncbi:MAG: replicative DNA helicase [Ruminococcaceae bacterium]|nr:replicative DNA helicase [Oscillospiraceae bacterium]
MAGYAEDFGRKLPYSVEAEQALLGSILIDPESINEVANIIKANDFYIESHKQIYLSMQSLFIKSKNIDVVTIINELVSSSNYNDEQAAEYIKMIASSVPSAANVKDYAVIVKNKSMLRQLIEACDDIQSTAFAEQGEFAHIIDSAESKIFSIAQGHETKDFEHIRDVLIREYEHLNQLRTDRESAMGLPTGFSALDNTLVGMSAGDLVLIGARPGVGKTSLVLNIASNVARLSKKTVCIFSLEMSNQQLVGRLLAMEALVDSTNMRSGMLTDEDWKKLAEASSILSECDILLDDTTNITVTGMKAKLRRVKNLGLIVVDYLQLMQSEKSSDNRGQEISDISRGLKLLAKELGVPLITCAQLNRQVESRTGKTPMLSDLRDSGAIEQDADVVMFIHQREEPEFYNKAELIIAKNRHGSTGSVELGWFRQYTKFSTLSELEEPN